MLTPLPKLALDFTTASLDSRITFTRSGTTATRVNASGYIESVAADAPRFDFGPVTLTCKGLLIEETRQNILTNSETFGTGWTKEKSTVTANQVVSPRNVQDATIFADDATTGIHAVYQTKSGLTASAPFALSCFVKKGSVRYVAVGIYVNATTNNCGVGVDLDTNTITGVGGNAPGYTASDAKIEVFKDGWVRVSVVCVTPVTTSFPAIIHRQTAYTGSGTALLQSYAGSTNNFSYIWGAQYEAGAFATSYIPTTTTALTRNADVATITGNNFSSFWQAGKGGVLVRAIPSTVSGIRPLIQFDDNTANEIIALRGNTTNPELYIVDGGTPQAQIDAGTIAANTAYSLTGWWQTNDCKARKDSGSVVTDTTATIPIVTQARLGSDGTNYLNGHLAIINYYDQFSGQIYTRRKNKVIFTVI